MGRYVGTYCGCLGCRKYPQPYESCQPLPADLGCSQACSSCVCYEDCNCKTGQSLLHITVEDTHIKNSPFLIEVVTTVGSACDASEVLQAQSKSVAGADLPIFVQTRDVTRKDSLQVVENLTLSFFYQDIRSFWMKKVPMISLGSGLFSAHFTHTKVGIYAYQAYLSEIPLSGGEKGIVRYGTETSVTLEDTANENDEFYTGYLVLVSVGSIGKLTQVTGYSGTSRRCTFADTLPFVLNTSFEYVLFPPNHVVEVVPGEVSPQQTSITCYSERRDIVFIDGSNCGLNEEAIASASFLFLVIFRDDFSNELTSGVNLDRLSMKISRLSSGADGSSMALSVHENWCSEQSMLSAEQCTQSTFLFQCEGQTDWFSTGRCGGQCSKEKCILIKSEPRTWHRSDGSLLAKYSG